MNDSITAIQELSRSISEIQKCLTLILNLNFTSIFGLTIGIKTAKIVCAMFNRRIKLIILDIKLEKVSLYSV